MVSQCEYCKEEIRDDLGNECIVIISNQQTPAGVAHLSCYREKQEAYQQDLRVMFNETMMDISSL